MKVSMTTYTVTDRDLLLGLDSLYRDAMQWSESTELLQCARVVCERLGEPPASVPVESYYTESEELTEYFLRMRALQGGRDSRRPEVEDLSAFRRLHEVASAPLFGTPSPRQSQLLPRSSDSLASALGVLDVDAWGLDRLVARARDEALASDDCSLVGLAARVGDAVVLTALRETVALYADWVITAAPGAAPPTYVWEVSLEMETAANRFVECFNELFDNPLPVPVAENVAVYARAASGNRVEGRCITIGVDWTRSGHRFYHWAVDCWLTGEPRVVEFWAEELWTTERFRDASPAEWRALVEGDA